MESICRIYLCYIHRMPKLPVGVDCTLSILQVCLRDREWTSKIDSGELPMYCENDLSLMYSTTIMRFLNHFSNIGHTKQTSMFKIASQLQIPEWIVKLRHQTAHGYELPSIGVLRIAINILLHWLHVCLSLFPMNVSSVKSNCKFLFEYHLRTSIGRLRQAQWKDIIRKKLMR